MSAFGDPFVQGVILGVAAYTLARVVVILLMRPRQP